jgi:hypothetical protein
VFILVPISPATCIAFGAFTDLLWLATVPPTNTLIVVMFGTRWLATLAGFAFFQSSGRRLHRRLARRRRVRPHRSYEPVWWLAILRAAAQAA